MSRVEGQDVVAAALRPTELHARGARQGAAGTALLLLAWFAATAWLRPLAIPDEGRYVGIAWEMLRSGDWLTPTLDGLPYFHKPPLFYWITAASMSVFGSSEGVARAAPVFGVWLATYAFYLFTRRWCGERLAGFATVALATMPLFYLGGQYANMDMLVAGFISATVLLLAHAAFSIEHGLPHRTALVAAYALAALGVLSKGLIGAALPILVIVAWLLVTRRARLVWPLVSATGVVAFFLITLPWFAALQWRFPGFLDYFFIVQQVRRFAESGYNNVRPFWFYPGVLVAGSIPWLPWFLPLFKRRAGGPGQGLGQAGQVRWLMIAWAAVVTVFFSIPQSKLPGYIFPAVPPLAYFVADALLGGATTTRRARRWWFASAALSAVIGIGVVIGVTLDPPRSSKDIALTLARERAPGEPIFMLDEYYFDVSFYARLAAPFGVVDEWDTPKVRARDNWRKELADAGDFDPARSGHSLVTRAQLPAKVCAAPASWFIGSPDQLARYGFLKLGRVVFVGTRATLWKVDPRAPAVAAALGCPG